MNHTLIRAAHVVFSASLWVVFGLALWRMDFSPKTVASFGRHLIKITTLDSTEPIQSSGLGYLP